MNKNMLAMMKRGFTLIELLVVIAIIGILAAVVLASLNDARTSGSDAAIKQSVGNIRSQAEIMYNTNSVFSYVDVCNSSVSTKVVALLTGIQKNNVNITAIDYAIASVGTTAKASCHSSAAGFAVSVPLNGGNYWCADSTGFAGMRTSVLAANAIVCPAT